LHLVVHQRHPYFFILTPPPISSADSYHLAVVKPSPALSPGDVRPSLLPAPLFSLLASAPPFFTYASLKAGFWTQRAPLDSYTPAPLLNAPECRVYSCTLRRVLFSLPLARVIFPFFFPPTPLSWIPPCPQWEFPPSHVSVRQSAVFFPIIFVLRTPPLPAPVEKGYWVVLVLGMARELLRLRGRTFPIGRRETPSCPIHEC